MTLSEDVERVAAAAAGLAATGEALAGVVAAEPLGRRVYLCAFDSAERQTWLALDDACTPIADLRVVREAASLAALCELAEESAGGGDLPGLRAHLRELRETENPPWIGEAEDAAAALADAIEPEPRLARHEYLDALGAASRRLEQALGQDAGSPFAAALQSAAPAV
ncbi:MAG TPA: hypothetical protein VHD91_12705, partial [Gaiellaceae bacterium]|nr:hypothetical protein [Gaiellaceae bacterium]